MAIQWTIQLHLKKKNNLYKIFIRNPSAQNKSNYTQYKNKLQSLIRTSKRIYFRNKFAQAQGNVKGTWNVINSLLNKGKHKPNPSYIVNDNITLDDNSEIADAFNDYL